jgi:hypothetical protein
MRDSLAQSSALRRGAAFGFIALVACLPLDAAAAWACTNAAGKTTFQDRPCEAKAPSDQWAAVRAGEQTAAGAHETLRRFDGAVSERDMASAGRLLSDNFRSVVVDKRGRSEVGRADFMDALTRTVHASKRYQRDRQCNDGWADPLSQTLRLECRKLERVEVMRRTSTSETQERVSLTLEGGEIRIIEISGIQPPSADAAAEARALPQR